MSDGLIAITGGTGFIGQHLVKRLAEQGRNIRLLVRNSKAAAELSGYDNVDYVPGDILTHINDTRVYESAKAAQIVSQLKPGDKVKLQFVREHMHQSTHFTVIEKPARRRSRL